MDQRVSQSGLSTEALAEAGLGSWIRSIMKRAIVAIIGLSALMVATAASADVVVSDPEEGVLSIDSVSGEITELTTEAGDLETSVSPDGSRVAFSRATESDSGIWVVDVRGGEERRVSPEGLGLNVRNPDWSPDGTQLAWSDRDDLWVTDLLSDISRRVTEGAENDGEPSWAPDGGAIAFTRFAENVDSGSAIAVVSMASGTVQVLAESDGGTRPEWSPNGDLIAWTQSAPSPPRVYTVAISGAGTVGPPMEIGPGTAAAWSPDGDALVLGSSSASDPALPIVRHDIRTGAERVVVDKPSGGVQSLSVSQDGSDLAVVLGDDDEVVLEVFSGIESDETTSEVLIRRRFLRDVEWVRDIAQRLAGATRVDTAVAVSRALDSAARPAAGSVPIFLATSTNYADALAVGPLVTKLNGRLLLVDGNGRLSRATTDEVLRLAPETAYVVGGTAAVSEMVEDGLSQLGVDSIERIGGADRFETASRIAERVGTAGGVVIAEGQDADPSRGWPDALVGGSLASREGIPILLVTTETVPDASRVMLEQWNPEHIIIVGGTTAVSDEVAQTLDALGGTIERIAGADRYATATQVAAYAAGAEGDADASRSTTVWLASGENWPDALVAVPSAGRQGAPLLLSPRAALGNAPLNFLCAHTSTLGRLVAVGGPDVLSARSLSAATAVLTDRRPCPS